jgi:hypothetical protein
MRCQTVQEKRDDLDAMYKDHMKSREPMPNGLTMSLQWVAGISRNVRRILQSLLCHNITPRQFGFSDECWLSAVASQPRVAAGAGRRFRVHVARGTLCGNGVL